MSIFKNRPVASALALALAVGVPASFYAAPAPVAAAQGDLDRAVAALRGISTMRANFVQTDRNGQAVSGVMTLKRPGKIRFEYEKGVPLLVVSNGKSMYMIDYEVNQVQRWPIKNSPLGALLDPSRDVKKCYSLEIVATRGGLLFQGGLLFTRSRVRGVPLRSNCSEALFQLGLY